MVIQKYKGLILALLSFLLFSACASEDDYELEAESLPVIDSNEEVLPVVDSSEVESGEADWIADYEKYIQETMAEDNIPGLALAIVQGDEIVFAKGYGLRDIAANAPVTTETLFHIGSTHKSMTAMLIATLVDDHLLQWDEPIVDFYPQFTLSDPDATEVVTIRHLLSMRCGIPDTAEGDLSDNSTPADVFEIASATDLLGMPGEAFSYSNISASVAGYLGVLAAGGDPDALYEVYAALLQERVLDPIGMETAVITASDAQKNPNYAESYGLDGKTAVLSETYDFDGDALAPSGSLKANVMEMALYISTQLNGGV
ncbi:MAG: serine hydrolase domain-containing protein, partial [Gallionellaceae bacterium]